MSDEIVIRNAQPTGDEAQPKRTLELDIVVESVKIGDIRALDNMGSGIPGAVDRGLKVLEKYITNPDFNIDDLEIDQLQAVSALVGQAIQERVNAKNSKGVSKPR